MPCTTNREKKKTSRECNKKLSELCHKNGIYESSVGDYSALVDTSSPCPPTRVPTLTCSKVKIAISPQKKADGGGGRTDPAPPGSRIIGPILTRLISVRGVPVPPVTPTLLPRQGQDQPVNSRGQLAIPSSPDATLQGEGEEAAPYLSLSNQEEPTDPHVCFNGSSPTLVTIIHNS
jgi:hypothetical protein